MGSAYGMKRRGMIEVFDPRPASKYVDMDSRALTTLPSLGTITCISLTNLTLGAIEATGTGTDIRLNARSSIQTDRTADSYGR